MSFPLPSLIIFFCLCFQNGALSQYFFHSGESVFVAAENGLNLRAEADPTSEVLAKLPLGTLLKCTGKKEGFFEAEEILGWKWGAPFIEVTFGEKTGFVAAAFVSRLELKKRSENDFAGSSIENFLKRSVKLINEQPLQYYPWSKEEPCQTVRFYTTGISHYGGNCWEEGGSEDLFIFPKLSLMNLFTLCKILGIDEGRSIEYEKETGNINIADDGAGCYFTLSSFAGGGSMLNRYCGC